jgi:hypothetical protein
MKFTDLFSEIFLLVFSDVLADAGSGSSGGKRSAAKDAGTRERWFSLSARHPGIGSGVDFGGARRTLAGT